MSLDPPANVKRFDLFDLIFVFFILAAGLVNILWFLTDNHIRGNDSSNHLFFSAELFRQLSSVIQGDLPFWEKITAFIKELGTPYVTRCVYWPQGFNLSACFFYSIAGTTLFAAKLNLLPYLFILLFSTYCLGKHIDSSPAGLVAAISLFFYPLIFQSSRQYQLDLPLTAMVALGLLFLLKTEQFQNTKYSFLFGIASGWAMLIKGQYAIFIIMPLLYVLFGIHKESWCEIRHQPFHSRQLRNLIFALAVSVPIAMIWWGPWLGELLVSLYTHIFDPLKNLERTPFPWSKKFSSKSIFFQTSSLFYTSLRPFFSALFFAALPIFLTKKIKDKGILLVWVIFPILFFSLAITLKHTRFLMPILPAMALITAVGLCHMKSRMLRLLVLWGGIFFAIFQFCVLSYVPARYRTISIGGFNLLGEEGFASDYETTSPPHIQKFMINKRFDMVLDLPKMIKKNSSVQVPRILLICSSTDIGFGEFEWAFRLLLRQPSFKFIFLHNITESCGGVLKNVDFVVYLCDESSKKIPGEFTAASFGALLRSSENWNWFENQFKLQNPAGWKSMLKNLAENDDRVELVLHEAAEDSAFAVRVYQKKK